MAMKRLGVDGDAGVDDDEGVDGLACLEDRRW
jgi:hypothetical protein